MGSVYSVEDNVGSLLSVVYLIVELPVSQVISTSTDSENSPPSGSNTGVATLSSGLVVYSLQEMKKRSSTVKNNKKNDDLLLTLTSNFKVLLVTHSLLHNLDNNLYNLPELSIKQTWTVNIFVCRYQITTILSDHLSTSL